MIVLGVDPGLASTGYALVAREGSRLRLLVGGTLRTSPRTPHAERLHALHRGVAAVIAEASVDSAAIERWFVHPVSASAMQMAEARGAILSAIAGCGVGVTEYAPNQIKQSVSGSGRADKAQVRAMVVRLCGADPGTDHEADAIAAAICHITGSGFAEAVARAR